MKRLFQKILDKLVLRPISASPMNPPPVQEAPRPSVPLPNWTTMPIRVSPAQGLPKTAPASVFADGNRPEIFDPAVKHYSCAFRPGDPTFAIPDDAHRWADARRVATDHVLRAIAESPLGSQLILRGSRLLRAWCGAAAREPGDLDYVVDPPTERIDEPWASRLEAALTSAVCDVPGPAGIEFQRGDVASDDIWTYERAPGRRVVFPWRAGDLPGGTVQLDAVFGEPLFDPARTGAIPLEDGGCVVVRHATPSQSLAWKVMWLESDMYPQGKDLYDTVLLAERHPLPRALLDLCLRWADVRPPTRTSAEFVLDWDVDWETFQKEYPWVTGDRSAWLNRLASAIGPTFHENLPAVATSNAKVIPSCWLTTDVVGLATAIRKDNAYDRLPILADALEEAGCDDVETLLHCRRNGPHSDGCRFVDQVLDPAK